MLDDSEAGGPEDWLEAVSARVREIVERAQEFDPDTLSTRDVVSVAVGAAMALGTVLVALGPGESAKLARRGARGKQEKETVTMAEEPMVAVIKNGKLTRRTRKQLHKQVNTLQKEITKLDKVVAKEARKAQSNAPTTIDAADLASHVGEDIGKRLAEFGAATAAATAPLIERARNFEIPDQVREGARQVAGSTRDGARQFAGSTRDGARQFAGSTREGARHLADSTRERTSDLADRVREEFVPLVVDRANRVQDLVRDEVVPQVAGQISRVRDEFVPQVAERLQQARDEYGPQVADAAARAGARASTLAASGAAASRKTAKNLASGDLGEQIGKQTRRGRKQAAAALANVAAQIDPPKERRGGGIWFFAVLAAVGGLLYYYVFQNEERRKKVMETAKSITEQGREIIRDFQGYDEEF